MTAQAVTGPKLRALAPGEPLTLGPLLDAAFSGYRDTTRFAQPVLDFLDGWAWGTPGLSAGLETHTGLVGVGLASLRQARWRGRDVRAVHLGPIGVRPGHRRQGLGSRLLAQLEQSARDRHADLLTLTTEVVYGAWRLYERHSFQVLETYKPIVRPLFPSLPDAAGPPHQTQVRAVDAATFAAGFVQPPGRAGAVVERWTGEPEPARVLRPRHLVCGPSRVATLRWPVLTRTPEGRVQVWATQILRLQGRGPSLDAALAQATRLAREDQSVCIYALPTVSQALPGFTDRGAPVVHRMVRPLTPWGEQVAQAASCWDEVCPAP